MNYPGLNKGDIIENILIEKLIFGGTAKATLSHKNPEHDGKTILITGGGIPGSVVNLRVLRKKKRFIEAQILETIQKSELEKVHPTNKYGNSGGWKWINIPYNEQIKIKEIQVKESFNHIKKHFYEGREEEFEKLFLPIVSSPEVDAYRNKVEFSFGKYISHKENVEEHFNLGFHKQGEFSKVVDFEGTPLIREIENEIMREIKKFSKTLGLPVYDQKKGEGFFRHLLIRSTFFTNEIMILLGFNSKYFATHTKLDKKEKLEKIKDFLISLTEKYNKITSIYFSYNSNKADIAIGDLECIYGKEYITEKLHGLSFQISPSSFFQTNSLGAEKLYSLVIEKAKNNNGIVLDLYGGTGTIGMIFANAGAKKVISVELSTSASKDGEKNAKLNNLENIEFVNAKVEDFLDAYLNSETNKADLLIIDPPRAGMHPKAVEDILRFDTSQMIYVSCNPSTLARDIEFILQNSDYKIENIQAMDMFPHTHHIETVVSLVK